MENHYDGIFLQGTNHSNSTTLGNLKNWKVNMHRIFRNKTLGYGIGTFLPNTTKNVFRQDLINQDLEMVWIELEINAKRVPIVNIIFHQTRLNKYMYLKDFLKTGETRQL